MSPRKARISVILHGIDQSRIFSTLDAVTLNPSDEIIYPRNSIFSANRDDFLIDIMISTL
jgi:hypothetical protein